MKLTSSKTYRVLRYALEKRTFRQLRAQKDVGVSFGLVNRTVNWMVSRGYAAKTSEGYKVIAPAALAGAFSFFRRMEELKTASLDVNVKPGDLARLFKEHGAVLCLSSALAYYDDYFRDPSFHVYGRENLVSALQELPDGRIRVEVYRDDLAFQADFTVAKNTQITTRTRTIIDLLCSQRAYAAERLIKKTWG